MRFLLSFFLFCPIVLWSQTFTESAIESGIFFSPSGAGFMGGGAAIVDINNDGWEDIYITGKNQMDGLFINDGTGLSFTNVSEEVGLSITDDYMSNSVAVGDLDRNGYRDILVGTADSDGRPLLFMQQTDGTFLELGIQSGLDIITRTMTCTMVDLNLDGYLDIYLGNYVSDPEFLIDDEGNYYGFAHECYPDHFFLNNGDGSFTDATVSYGFDNNGCTLALAATDYNRDRKPDIMVANDFGEWVVPNRLYENQYPTPAVIDVAEELNADIELYGMGIATADVNGDLSPDYYVTSLGDNALLMGYETTFTDLTAAYGVLNGVSDQNLFHTGWGTFFFDADNDSWPDLYVSNGHMPTIDTLDNEVRDKNKFFRNLNGEGFEDLSIESGLADSLMGRGAAFGDLDKDGDLDVVLADIISTIPSTDDRLKIFYNDGNDNHWVQFELQGTTADPDAFNAQVEVYAGGRAMWQEVQNASSYSSQSSRILHFGLGQSMQVDSVKVFWPLEGTSTLVGLAVDSLYVISQSFLDNVERVSSNLNIWNSGEELFFGSELIGNRVELILQDVQGRVISKKSFGAQQRQTPFDSPTHGIYFAHIRCQGKWHVLRVVL